MGIHVQFHQSEGRRPEHSFHFIFPVFVNLVKTLTSLSIFVKILATLGGQPCPQELLLQLLAFCSLIIFYDHEARRQKGNLSV